MRSITVVPSATSAATTRLKEARRSVAITGAAGQIGYALDRLTEPLLRPIRRVLPDLGGIDISPIVLLIGLQFLGILVDNIFFSLGWA